VLFECIKILLDYYRSITYSVFVIREYRIGCHMLKPQDIVIVLKILAKGDQHWAQGSLAVELGMSASEVNAGIKRALASGLLRKKNQKVIPVKQAIEEFLIHGLKYVFPVERGEPTRGIAAAYAADIFKNKILISDELPPVWPDPEGEVSGFSLKPLYKSVPYAVKQDPALYEYLSIADVLRSGRAREIKIARKMIHELLQAA